MSPCQNDELLEVPLAWPWLLSFVIQESGHESTSGLGLESAHYHWNQG